MIRLKIPEPVWITTDSDLRAACQQWSQEPYLALDTEFMRTSTFYPQAGLVQVAGREGCFLIDPLLITDWSPLAELLTHPLVVKVFHACAEDLEVCRCLTGVMPAPLADTQLAAALAGLGGSMGFQRVVNEVLEINLPKEETRSDWLQRPLRDEQISYAVADVHYLYRLYPKLMSLLKQQGRQHWLSEECERLLVLSEQADQHNAYYRRIKLAWKLRPQELLLLQQLSLWRERQARERNVPRGKVVDDNTLWNIARFKAANNDQLARAALHGSAIRNDGKEIIAVVNQVLALDKKLWPKMLDRPLSPHAGQWFKVLRDAVASKAEALQIPPELLANKKALEALLRSGYPKGPYRLPDLLRGWRQVEIGNYLLQLLQELQQQPVLRNSADD
ncbi:ribonuclease D [Venatoribacter cucullus]|uniref:Ribonuclease D n=1 Tax=Venatoribacter cucullus TaxID=2661630 RepID=A0A9X7UY55_9GAMM|nr:ribonuclease D [Venatoribacter cucullus]QQD24235.1 ribonuclease D [Venatoribacter cucullus]